jgi:hypothetical protein
LLLALGGTFGCARANLEAPADAVSEQEDAISPGGSGLDGVEAGAQGSTGEVGPPAVPPAGPVDAAVQAPRDASSGGGGFEIPDFGRDRDAAAPALSDLAPTSEGQLVISELMPHPVGGAPHEWIELHNPTDSTFDLVGCVLRSEGNEHTIADSLIVPAQSYSVLARDEAADDGVVSLYIYDRLSLSSSDDTLSLQCGEVLIDRMSYDTTLTERAQSIQLSAHALSATANDEPSSWCLGTASVGASENRGTPSLPNEACP